MSEAFGYQFEVFAGFKEHSSVSVAHGVDRIAVPESLRVHIEVAYRVRAHEFTMLVVDDQGIAGAVSCETV